MDGPPISRRDSVTSFNSTTSAASSTISRTAPRDLSTESMYDIDERFLRKSRSKVQPGLSRSTSMSMLPYQQRQLQQQRYNYNHHPQQQQQQQHRPRSFQQSQPPALQSQLQRGSFYFPNGEIFTPRQTPKSRHRPNKIHQSQYQPPQPPPTNTLQYQQRKYPISQSPSMPNLVSSQNDVPPRRNPGLMRNSMSFQNPILLQQQQQHLKPPFELQHEKRPSSSSSLGSSPSKLQQISSSSSSTLSLGLLNSSASPTPSNVDDTPASSISYDEKLTSLTSEVSNIERVDEQILTQDSLPVDDKKTIIEEDEEVENEREESVKSESLEPPQTVQTSSSSQREDSVKPESLEPPETVQTSTQREDSVKPKSLGPLETIQTSSQNLVTETKSVSNPVQIKKRESLSTRPLVTKRVSTYRAPVEKTSFMGKVLKKLFGSSTKKAAPVAKKLDSSLQKPIQNPKRKPSLSKEPEFLPKIDETEDDFKINFDEELKDTESILSFTKNDEIDVNISSDLASTNKEIDAKKTDDERYMNFFDDENFLLKMIEVGETTFPDLGRADLGTNRRKSLKMQKNLSRNSTISSQNSNNSIKTFKTSSSYLEDLDRIIWHFEQSNSNEDRIENLQIIRNNTLKLPHNVSKKLKSALKIGKPQSRNDKNVIFANKIYLNDTHSSSDYDRFNIELKTNYQALASNPHLVKEIRLELNIFKEQMEIHELSRQNTHLFG